MARELRVLIFFLCFIASDAFLASPLMRARRSLFSCHPHASTEADSSSQSIKVAIEKILAVPVPQARNAWLEYQWKGGGGLPVAVWSKDEITRVVMPAMLEETLQESGADEIRYAVTGCGLLSTELEPGTHIGKVRFMPTEDGARCRMVWETSFEARYRQWLWDAVTQQMIGDAAANLQSHVARPQRYMSTTVLSAANKSAALDAWLHFVWTDGGGLPLLPPIMTGEAGEGCVRSLLPPGLQEKILSVDRDLAEVRYEHLNPGLPRFPAHSYSACVQFSETSVPGEVEMRWTVDVRPLNGFQPLARGMTETIIGSMARNLQVHLAEPGATVEIAPPRGFGKPFASVRKDSWLGSVLDAHVRDSRSTAEQTLSLLKPWTWGRTGEAAAAAAQWCGDDSGHAE